MEPFISEQQRSAVEGYIKGLDTVGLREICKDYGADASGTRVAMQTECILLLDDLASRRDDDGLEEFQDRVFHRANAPWLRPPQSGTGLQQFSGITAQDSSRFHAGNSYVGHQNNYYAPTTPTPQAPGNETFERVQDLPALLAALEFPQMNSRRANINKEFSGTCTWLESTEEYKRWREPWKHDRHCILWIKGVPGAGKSTIMRYACCKELLSSYHMAIVHFFNAKGSDLEKSVEGMFRALLYQLVSLPICNPRLPAMVSRNEMEYYKEHGWPLALLKDLFREGVLFQANGFRPVVSYIDALDECAEDEVRELLTYFEDLAEDNAFSESPRVCISSRPYPNITTDRCETILLDRRSEHKDDIGRYALSRLRAGRLDEPRYSQYRGLISEIIERSSGVFLWVILVVAQLRKSADRGVDPYVLREHLLDIPPALHDLFDTIINQDDANDCLLPIVQWVLFAQGRMRAIDLYFAVKLSTGSLQGVTAISDWTSFDERWLRNFVLTSSKAFLRTTDNESISYMPCEFIHESVREYFLDDGLRKLDPSLGSDVVTASHARLAQTCQRYLDKPISKDHLASASLHSMGAPSNSDALDPAPMMAYMRDKGAFLHAEIADRNGIPQTEFCNNFAFAHWLELMQYPRYEPKEVILFDSKEPGQCEITLRQHYTSLSTSKWRVWCNVSYKSTQQMMQRHSMTTSMHSVVALGQRSILQSSAIT